VGKASVGKAVAAAWAGGSLVAIGFACGGSSTPVSTFDGGFDSGGGSRLDATRHDGNVKSADGGGKLHPTDGSTHFGDAPVTPPDGGLEAACAAHTTPAKRIPAYLVFVMDRSDSMKQYGKWPACSAALEAFFDDPSTQGIYSSLTFMPFVADGAVDDMSHAGYSCSSTDYVTAAVPTTALPSARFKPVIEAEKLALGTPTTPALEGATAQAVAIKQANPTAKVLIVLATDGYPAGCTGNSVKDVAKAAHVAATTDGIPVYVIGVGPDNSSNEGISNLDTVAEAGTTHGAFFIPTEVDGGDAGITEEAFLAAVHQIQGSLGCYYDIPAPPAGQQLDYDKVNVVLSASGKKATLSYSADCSDPSGWHYEETTDGGTPEKIVLCDTACATAKKAGATGSVSIELGCDTAGGIPK
jgi:hypothetical protein